MENTAVRHVSAKGTWTNLAQIGECTPSRNHYPATTEALASLFETLSKSGAKCRIAGAGKSPNTCTFTSDHLVHMDKLNKILQVDRATHTITCQGGVIMEDMMNALDASDLMLTCVPSYVKTTLAGCLATASHSSGKDTRGICDYVKRLVLVDGTGKTHIYTEDDKDLALVVCGLGALGAITEVTLNVEDKAVWRLDSRPLSLKDAMDEAKLAQKVREHDYYRFWWVPHTESCYESIGYRINWAQASEKDKAEYAAWKASEESVSNQVSRAARGDWLRHTVVQNSLYYACGTPSMQPYINKSYAATFYSQPTTQYGSAMECFTFDCLFTQWANEWAIEASRAVEAFKKLQEMINRDGMRLHFPVEFRFSPPDRTRLSPAYGRPTCWLGVVMYRPYLREAADTKRCYDGFCDIMQSMEGRPHWAKYYTWESTEAAQAYGEAWGEFLALRQKMDPQDIFVNGWLHNLISDDGKHRNSTAFYSP